MQKSIESESATVSFGNNYTFEADIAVFGATVNLITSGKGVNAVQKVIVRYRNCNGNNSGYKVSNSL